MKKPMKKDLNKGQDVKTGKKDQPNRKKTGKTEQTDAATPMQEDAGYQDGSAGLSGTSAI
jgi:hypothetical protein